MQLIYIQNYGRFKYEKEIIRKYQEISKRVQQNFTDELKSPITPDKTYTTCSHLRVKNKMYKPQVS